MDMEMGMRRLTMKRLLSDGEATVDGQLFNYRLINLCHTIFTCNFITKQSRFTMELSRIS